jgi:hypothetical protein
MSFGNRPPVCRGLRTAIVLAGAILACSDGARAKEPAPASKELPATPGAVKGTLGGKRFDVRSAVSGLVWGAGGGVTSVKVVYVGSPGSPDRGKFPRTGRPPGGWPRHARPLNLGPTGLALRLPFAAA